MPVINTIQIRRDTAANWTSTDPELAAGEIGLETDTGKFKFGTGTDDWTDLPYALENFIRTLPAQISSKTAAYTLVAGDTNDLIQANGTFTITVPDDTIPVGTRVDIVNIGTGVITIAGDGLTLQSKDSAVTIDTQYAAATLFFTATDTALLVGDLA
jgi:hypothetical protein